MSKQAESIILWVTFAPNYWESFSKQIKFQMDFEVINQDHRYWFAQSVFLGDNLNMNTVREKEHIVTSDQLNGLGICD